MTFFSETAPVLGRKAVLLAEDDPELLAIAEQFGGMAAMNERSLRGHRAFQRLYGELDTLYEQYPDHWVAMDEDGLVAVADSQDNLLQALADQGQSAAYLATEYLDTQPDLLIL